MVAQSNIIIVWRQINIYWKDNIITRMAKTSTRFILYIMTTNGTRAVRREAYI